jgi:hypothetical protein
VGFLIDEWLIDLAHPNIYHEQPWVGLKTNQITEK